MFIKRMAFGVEIKSRIRIQRRNPLRGVLVEAKRQVEKGLDLFAVGEINLQNIHKNGQVRDYAAPTENYFMASARAVSCLRKDLISPSTKNNAPR